MIYDHFTIIKTAYVYLDPQGDFICESVLAPGVRGIGDSSEEALLLFEQALRELPYPPATRHISGTVSTHSRIRIETNDVLARLSVELGLSRGETIDVAIFQLSKCFPALHKKMTIFPSKGSFLEIHIRSLNLEENPSNFCTSYLVPRWERVIRDEIEHGETTHFEVWDELAFDGKIISCDRINISNKTLLRVELKRTTDIFTLPKLSNLKKIKKKV